MGLTATIRRVYGTYLPAGSLRARMANGTLWTLFGSVIAQFVGVVASIACARILGAAEFGELGMIRSTALLFGVLTGAGLGMAATKYIAEYRVADPDRAGRMIGLLVNAALVLGACVTLLAILFGDTFAASALNAPHLAGALKLACLLLVINAFNGIQLGALCGFEAFRAQSRLAILDGLFNLVFVSAGAFIYGVTGAIAGSVVAGLLGYALKQTALQSACRSAGVNIRHSNVCGEIGALWKFVLPAILVGVSIQPFEWLGRLMIARQPNGYIELGIFTAAFAWSQFVGFLPSQVAGPMMPIIANLLASGRAEQVRKIVISSQLFVSFIAAMTALPLCVLAPYVMRVYGAEFGTGAGALITMSIAYAISSITQVTRAFFAASSRMWWQAANSLLWGVLLIVTCNYLSHLGSLGLALSYLIAFIVVTATLFGSQIRMMNQLVHKRALA